ncbi:uncharacterized protein LOC128189523 isoform X2 [Crassostrea angulata]|uniref:uncharacterized protein LOC128189523 isoform X2 n=1 Tax=Magallana angulata TaxID=2784310 RepID=UPI0005C3A973|nr:uncharacterized protein LOC105321703 isoform X2 [Crassostrea gigas]XP_052717128.1 uncharacterized protein LOC128189523 isoform X2 [Crassostrea angulata]|eukprot:XP_011418415.1 PREDICTED: uncharacterized protein LOC105321703 isoform X2 [Crassostrea gigas]
MNFHLDKIECVFILLNILMVHITSANISSSYKLKNIILPPYIGKLQDGLDSKILALRKPYVHVQIDGRTDVSDGPLIRTDVALFPDMTLYDAIAEASVRFGVEHPCVQNPYRMEVASASSNCYTVINVPGVVSNTSSRWIIKIVRRRGRIIYEDECLPSGRISMRGGTTVTFKKTN